MEFKTFAIITIVLWISGILFSFIFKNKKAAILSEIFIFAGFAVLIFYMIQYWIKISRPPFKTLGETRLWYSLLLAFTGLLVNLLWRIKWFLHYCVLVSIVFLIINILKPELQDKTLVPALQSPWFIPHVVIYIQAYALLAGAFFCALRFIFFTKTDNDKIALIKISDKLIYLGFSFLTIGMILGAFWAKIAWGNYWAWDPKETWALIGWVSYLAYIHIRIGNPKNLKFAALFIIFSFITILICWLGMKLIPYAQTSVHFY